jgi:hypothetical protein
MQVFDLDAGEGQVGWDEIRVEFDGAGAGLFDQPCIIVPAGAADAIEAGNYRYGDRLARPPDDF